MKSIEEIIRKAMEEGQFKDLKGKGKPLQMDDHPHENPEWRMAHQVLKNGGFTLPWIEKRQEIENELAALQKTIKRAWLWRREALERKESYQQVESEWQRAINQFEQEIEKLNQAIRKYNLEVPSSRFQLMLVNASREIEKSKLSQAE